MIRQNTFSGNRGYGLAITGRAHDNQVIDSYIGTGILGLTALGNGRGGVLVAGTGVPERDRHASARSRRPT